MNSIRCCDKAFSAELAVSARHGGRLRGPGPGCPFAPQVCAGSRKEAVVVQRTSLCPDLHSPDEAVLHLVDVFYDLIREHLSRPVADDLMHADRDPPLSVPTEGAGLDMRIKCRPLTLPVLLHAIAPFLPNRPPSRSATLRPDASSRARRPDNLDG
jgi:hypothetical protein